MYYYYTIMNLSVELRTKYAYTEDLPAGVTATDNSVNAGKLSEISFDQFATVVEYIYQLGEGKFLPNCQGVFRALFMSMQDDVLKRALGYLDAVNDWNMKSAAIRHFVYLCRSKIFGETVDEPGQPTGRLEWRYRYKFQQLVDDMEKNKNGTYTPTVVSFAPTIDDLTDNAFSNPLNARVVHRRLNDPYALRYAEDGKTVLTGELGNIVTAIASCYKKYQSDFAPHVVTMLETSLPMMSQETKAKVKDLVQYLRYKKEVVEWAEKL
jgi:hypothetical protein